MTSIPLVLQTAYAELLERCASASFEHAYSEPGSFTSKNIAGRQYWYFQPATREGRKQRYVGPETDDLLERIRTHRRWSDDLRERRTLVSTLVRSAYLPRLGEEMGVVLAALSQSGIFNRGAVLVGTVAYQAYAAMLAERLPGAAMMTDDIDIAGDRTVSVTVEEAESLLDILRSVDRGFQPVYGVGTERAVSYRTAKLRVDALVPNAGTESEKPVFSSVIGSDAAPLRFIDFLIRNPLPAALLHDGGIYVSVPAPERYAVHKLIVAQRRSVASAKVDKDLRQAESLLTILVRKSTTELRDVWREAWSTGKKWKQLLALGLSKISPNIRDEVLQMVELTRSSLPISPLRFDDPVPRDVFDRGIVVFEGKSGETRATCAISREALEDHFGGDGLDRAGRARLVRKNQREIEAMAALKYAHWPIEDPRMTLVKTEDVPRLRAQLRHSKPVG